MVLVRLKALVVFGDELEEYGYLLAVGRAETKCLVRTLEDVNVKDIMYSAKCALHVMIFEVSESAMVEAKSLVMRVS